MLTGPLLRVRFSRDLIVPKYVDARDEEHLLLAEQLLEVFQSCEGMTRGELERELAESFGDDPGQFLFRGLVKLLEDRAEFAIVSGHPPEQVREAAFRAADVARKAGVFDRGVVLEQVANELGMPVQVVEDGLFADLKSEQRLIHVEATTSERLLERYNLALAQAVLLKAVRVQVDVRGLTPARMRRLFRQIKFHRLVCEVTKPKLDSWRLNLDGPLSLFSATQKYGLQLALFLPTIVACRDFSLEADLRWGAQKQPKRFVLKSADGLTSTQAQAGTYLPPEVAMFAELFRKRITDWQLLDETEAFPLGDSFWVPDFRLIHTATGKSIGLEVLGFWRKSGAIRHLERLKQHAAMPYLVAVSDSLKIDDEEADDLANVIRFRQMPLPDVVITSASQILDL